jgi:hypothetical protein
MSDNAERLASLASDFPDLPEGVILDCGAILVGYIQPDGSLGYAARWMGERPSTAILGLIEKAKLDLYFAAQEWD